MLSILALFGLLAAEPQPPPWRVASAHYDLRIGEPRVGAPGEVVATLRYQFVPSAEGWFEGVIVGPNLVVTAVDGPAIATPKGLKVTLAPGKQPVSVTVQGVLPSSPGAFTLPVLPAAIQTVQIDAPGMDVVVDRSVDGFLLSSNLLSVHYAPHQERAPARRETVSTATVATAFWGSEGTLEVRSVIKGQVRQGELRTMEINVARLSEVDVTGGQISAWQRNGDRVVVTFRAPVKGAYAIAVSGRASPSGVVPSVSPLGALRVDRWWTLCRSDGQELVPKKGLSGVSLRALPDWARAIGETAPIASYHSDRPPELEAVTWTPLMGPDTVVERAELLLSTNEDGRVLLRGTWYVRNERRQYLHFLPAPGWTPVAARSGSRPLTTLSDSEGGLYISLEKSVETLQGPLSYPVEVTWIATGDPFEKRRGAVALSLPAVDAPVQSVAWELHLPRGYTAPGAAVRAEPGFATSTGTVAWEMAVRSYQRNDFQTAQAWLDRAQALAPADANVDRLQANLDVFLQPAAADDAQSRRVKDMANARTGEERLAQAEAYQKAKKAEAKGDVEESERQWAAVAASAARLSQVEQAENVEQRALYEEANSNLASLKQQKNEPASGTVGSVLGGMVAGLEGQGESIVDGEPPEPAEPEAPVEVVAPEFLERIPTGRSYQSVAGTAAGVTTRSASAQPAPARSAPAKTPSTTTTSTTPMPAAAPPPPPPPPPPPMPVVTRTEIDFEGIDVSGELEKPSAALALDQKKAESVVPLRDDFATEAEEDAREVVAVPSDDLPEEEWAEDQLMVISDEPIIIMRSGLMRKRADEPSKERPLFGELDTKAEVREALADPRIQQQLAADPAAEAAMIRQVVAVGLSEALVTRARPRAIPVTQPSPLTLAMPLEGLAVTGTAALLEAGDHPTITLLYRYDASLLE